MTVSILRPVGAGAKAINQKPDVYAIQNQLNGHMGPSRTYLVVDGKSGRKTCAAIRDFQSGVCRFSRPDGRVDPNGRTLAALNDPASTQKWARMSIYAPPANEPSSESGGGSSGDAGLQPRERAGRQLLLDQVERLRPTDPRAADDLDEFIKDHFVTIKGIVAVIGSSSDALSFANAVKVLRNVGFSIREIGVLFGDLARPSMKGSPQRALNFIGKIGSSGTGLARALKGLGRAAIVASVVIAALEAYNYYNRGAYGAAAGEIYKCAMSIAVPWAGLIDAFQSIVEASFPNVRSPAWSAFLKVLKAANPIGLGGVGIDAYVTTVGVILKLFKTGRVDMAELDRLVRRMKSGPAGFFAEVGEALGDRMADASGDWFYENVLQHTDIFD